MSDGQDWYNSLQNNLQNEDSRMDTLTEIRNRLSTVSADEATETANLIQVPLLFDCLNDSNAEQIDLACEVLTLCMATLTVGESTNRFSESLERALKHPCASVKLMTLQEIHRYTVNDTAIKQLCNQNALLLGIISCIDDEDLGVASKAGEIITAIGKTDVGLTQLLQRRILLEINNGITGRDLLRFRIYEIIVNIASTNSSSLQATINAGWITKLISELKGDDVLLQLNALELLSNIASTPHGRNFIESENLPTSLAQQLIQIKEDPLASLLLPGLIKFFGNLAFWQPREVFESYPVFLSELLDPDHFTDPTYFGVTVDTIGHIASTIEGKTVLNALGPRMTTTLGNLGRLIGNLPVDNRVRLLGCLENIIRVAPEHQNDTINAITYNWFKEICADPMDMVVKYIKTPFPEVRLAGLHLLEAVAQQVWGQELIFKTAGLIEYLMDRAEENTKLAKDLKFEIVKALTMSPSCIIDGPRAEQIQLFIKQGPYYADLPTQVAVEGNPN